MKKKKPNTTTEVPNKDIAADNFWGQPHEEDEKFSIREFEVSFLNLFMNEPFLGSICMEMQKCADPKVSTAYVSVNPDTYELKMGYNPYFFRSLSETERVGVIKHEIYHVVFRHLFERNVTDSDYARIWNISTDLAINSMIGKDNLPNFALIPGVAPPNCGDQELSALIAGFKEMLVSEYYFEQIKKLVEQQEQSGNGDGAAAIKGMTLDDHDVWGDLPTEVTDQLRDAVDSVLKRATDKADSTNEWGTVPVHIQEEIRKSFKREVDWRSILRQFFGTVRCLTRISTIKKISKKMPGVVPGVKRGTMARFAFFIDQSGSMSDEDVALCFAEVEGACKESEIDVYNFDTEVDEASHKVWKRGKNFPWGRTRCGGTDFNAVASFVNDPKNRGKWAGVCILTDGYAPTMGNVNRARVLWVITPQGTKESVRQGDLVVQLKKDKVFQTK